MELTLMLAVLGFLIPSTLSLRSKFDEFEITHLTHTPINMPRNPIFECEYKAVTAFPYSLRWRVRNRKLGKGGKIVLADSKEIRDGKNLHPYFNNFLGSLTMSIEPDWSKTRQSIADNHVNKNEDEDGIYLYVGKLRLRITNPHLREFIQSKHLVCEILQDDVVVARDVRYVEYYSMPNEIYFGNDRIIRIPEGENVRIERTVECIVDFVYPPPEFIQLVSQETGLVVSADGHNQYHITINDDRTHKITVPLKFMFDPKNYNDTYRCQIVMGVDIGKQTTITSHNVTEPFDLPEGISALHYTGPTMIEVGTEVNLTAAYIPNPRYVVRWSASKFATQLRPSRNRSMKLALISRYIRLFCADMYNIRPSFNDRFDILGTDLSRGLTKMTIFDVNYSDERQFQCEVLSYIYGPVVSRELINIKVFKKPDRVYVHSHDMVLSHSYRFPKRIVATKTETCTAYRVYPQPQYMQLVSKKTGHVLQSYRYVDNNVRNMDGTFTVTYSFKFPINNDHHGEYYECHVIIGHDSHKRIVAISENTTRTIYVNHPTTFATLTISENPVEVGQNVTFTCESNGYPLDKFEIRSVYYHVLIVKSEDKYTKKIQTTLKADGLHGRYVCVANGIKSPYQDFKVNYAPDPDYPDYFDYFNNK